MPRRTPRCSAATVRLCRIAHAFLTGSTFSQEAVMHAFWPGLNPESAKRAFRRERADLSRIGIDIVNVGTPSSPIWAFDKTTDLAFPTRDTVDCASIDLLVGDLRDILDDLARERAGSAGPAAPLSAKEYELIRAMRKLMRFSEASHRFKGSHEPAPSREDGADERVRHVVARARQAADEHASLSFLYRGRDGRAGRREVAVTQVDMFLGRWYVIGRDLADGTVKRFRADRFDTASHLVIGNPGCHPPACGDPDDIRFPLPFELGDGPAFAITFALRPGMGDAELRALVRDTRATAEGEDPDRTWTCRTARSLPDAARWAVWAAPRGLTAREPRELLDAVDAHLDAALAHYRQEVR